MHLTSLSVLRLYFQYVQLLALYQLIWEMSHIKWILTGAAEYFLLPPIQPIEMSRKNRTPLFWFPPVQIFGPLGTKIFEMFDPLWNILSPLQILSKHYFHVCIKGVQYFTWNNWSPIYIYPLFIITCMYVLLMHAKVVQILAKHYLPACRGSK